MSVLMGTGVVLHSALSRIHCDSPCGVSKKVYTFVLLVAVLWGTLSLAHGEESPQELVVWIIWHDRGLEAAFRKFEVEYPGYRIITGFHTGVTGTGQQKLLTAIAGGSPPDVLIFDRFSVGEWAVRNALQPMDALMAATLTNEAHARHVKTTIEQQEPETALPSLERLSNAYVRFPGSRIGRLAEEMQRAIQSGEPADHLIPDAELLVELCEGIHEEDFYEACLLEGSYTDETGRLTPYTIPHNADSRALYYNTDLLERAGFVDEAGRARPPSDWDELKEYAVALTEYDAAGNITRLGFSPQYGNSWLYLYGWQNGGRFMSEDGRTCTLDDPRIVEALQYMVDVYEALGGIEKVSLFETTFQAGELDPFLSGKVVMKIDGDWFLTGIADLAPGLRFGVAPAPPPRGRDPITWSGGYCWAIPEGARHTEAAFELVRFLNTTRLWMFQGDVNARFFRSRGRAYVPRMAPLGRINDLYNERFIENNPDLPFRVRAYFPLFYDLMNVSLYRPVTPVGTLLWDEHARAAERGWRKTLTPQETLERGQRNVQRQLDLLYTDHEYAQVRWIWVACVVIGLILLAALALVAVQGPRNLWNAWRQPESRAGLLFVSPWLIGFSVFTAGPVIVSFIYSFCRYDVLNPAEWVGLDNYRQLLFEDPLFWRSLANTAYMLIGIPLGMAAGLGIALLLNTEVRGMKFYRTLFYLPAIVPMVASAILWIWVLNPSNGLVNSFLRMFGIANPPLWLQSPSWLLGSKAAIILMGLWGAGAGMIIWLAGLKGIPRHLYEAAEIDGAGPIRRFFSVTLPMLSPYIFFNMIMGIIGTMQIFTQAYIMTLGGPEDSTMFYAYYLFNSAFNYFKMGYASSMAWLLMVLVCALTLFQLWLSKKWVYYGGE